MSRPFVYFDLGMVLVEFEHRLAVEQLAELCGASSAEIHQLAFVSGLQEQYETGLISSADYVQRIHDGLSAHELAPASVLEAISAIFQPPRQSIVDILAKLKAQGIPMGILSNTCEAHWQWIVKQGWEIPGAWFDFEVLSYEVQSMKPDSKIYEVCEIRAERPPEDLFFTDDKVENVNAAKSRGWQTHWLQGDDAELEAALDSWLDKYR